MKADERKGAAQKAGVRSIVARRVPRPAPKYFMPMGFSIRSRHHPDEDPLPHMLRDGHAALEVSDVLYSLGYRRGPLLLNYPTRSPADPLPMDLASFDASQLVLVTTRPPLHDLEDGRRKPPPPRSHSPLETAIFDLLERKYFRCCRRSQIMLADALVAGCPPDVRRRSNIMFRLYKGASYLSYTSGDGRDGWCRLEQSPTTAAYLVCEPQIWPGGPALLLAFGMSGVETLAWAYLLRTRFAHLVGRPGFVMAEISTKPIPKRPTDLSFVDEWDVEILTGPQPVWVDDPPPRSAQAGR